jgi:hypothetical protein
VNSEKNVSKFKEIEMKIFKNANADWSTLNFSEISGGATAPLPIAGYDSE